MYIKNTKRHIGLGRTSERERDRETKRERERERERERDTCDMNSKL